MPSKLDIASDPYDTLEIAPDVVLVARAAAEFPTLAPDGAGQPHDRRPNIGTEAASTVTAPRVDTTFRATDVNEVSRLRSSGGRWAKTAGLAFAFAFVSAFGTAAWERYGDQAQAMVMSFAPRLELPSWLPNPLAAASVVQPNNPAPLPSNATEQAAATTTPPADSGASGATAAPQAAAPDTEQTLQSVSHDIASLTQQIETLKAGIAELKASQEQMSRDMASRDAARAREVKPPEARLSEARPVEARPSKLGAPPKPLGAIVQHKPKPPAYPLVQSAGAAPLPPPGSTAPPPVQIAPPPDSSTSADDVVVRPPMPLR